MNKGWKFGLLVILPHEHLCSAETQIRIILIDNEIIFQVPI